MKLNLRYFRKDVDELITRVEKRDNLYLEKKITTSTSNTTTFGKFRTGFLLIGQMMSFFTK